MNCKLCENSNCDHVVDSQTEIDILQYQCSICGYNVFIDIFKKINWTKNDHIGTFRYGYDAFGGYTKIAFYKHSGIKI